jgi:hypothetical protein
VYFERTVAQIQAHTKGNEREREKEKEKETREKESERERETSKTFPLEC